MLEARARRLMATWHTEEACAAAQVLLRFDPSRPMACLILAEGASRQLAWSKCLRWLLQAFALGQRDVETMLKTCEAAVLSHDPQRAQMMLHEVAKRGHELDPSQQRRLHALVQRAGLRP